MSSDKDKEAMGDHADEKTALKEHEEDEEKMVDGDVTASLDDSRFDDSKVKFVNGGATAEAHVDIEGQTKLDDQEFIGLTKEELERYANDPFWVRTRWALFVLFWVAWIGMLVAAIIIIVLAPKCPPRPKLDWYQKSVIYQVYPRSFQDTNGDGNGDLNGVTAHLKYLDEQLNASAVLINSIYPSPNKDWGYDVTNFTDIHQDFGTIDDFKAMLEEMKDRGMKVILDFVPNHSSSLHPWFKASQRRTGNYDDYYIWHSGNNDTSNKPPNNWLSVYGDSAWTYDTTRKQHYLHQYGSEQPDLNLRNEKVLEELDGVLRFWLDMGVDGFRVHAAAHLVEGNLNADEPQSGQDVEKNDYDYLSHVETAFQPETYDLITRWRAVVDSYKTEDDVRVLLVEAYGTSNQTQTFYKPGGQAGAHLVSNMNLLNLKTGCDAGCVYSLVDNWMKDMPEEGWESWTLGNQDHSRLATRMGDDYVNLANMLLMTLPGTPTTYYGEEIGMRDVMIPFDQTKDPMGKVKGRASYMNYSRDPERTPMQWLGKENAGFTFANATPWLPICDDYRNLNVKAQMATGAGFSSLRLYSDLSVLRQEPSFQWGNLEYGTIGDSVFSYVRQAQGFDGFLVVLNFGPHPATFNLNEEWSSLTVPQRANVVLTSANFKRDGVEYDFKEDKEIALHSIHLEPSEGFIVRWAPGEPKSQSKSE